MKQLSAWEGLIIISLLILLGSGCDAGSAADEDQRINQTITLDSNWQTIAFERPLMIDHHSIQRLHLGYDPERYRDNMSYLDQTRTDLSTTEEPPLAETFAIRRVKDGALLTPEIELISPQGRRTPLTASSRIQWWNGGFTIGYDWVGFANWTKSTLPYPADVRQFSAMRIRSNEPTQALFFLWKKDHCIHGSLPDCDPDDIRPAGPH